MKIKLPTKKELNGQRLGQAIVNALSRDDYKSLEIVGVLFYIENEDLIKLLEGNMKLHKSHRKETTL